MDDVAKDLQELTEQINPLIERAEEVLRKLYAVQACVDLDRERTLWWFNQGKGWRLLIQSSVISSPLVQASREVRLLALRALPKLEKELDLAKRMGAGEFDGTLRAATEYVDGLEKRTRR